MLFYETITSPQDPAPTSDLNIKQPASRSHEGFPLIFLLLHVLLPPPLQAPPRKNSWTLVKWLLTSACPQPVPPLSPIVRRNPLILPTTHRFFQLSKEVELFYFMI